MWLKFCDYNFVTKILWLKFCDYNFVTTILWLKLCDTKILWLNFFDTQIVTKLKKNLMLIKLKKSNCDQTKIKFWQNSKNQIVRKTKKKIKQWQNQKKSFCVGSNSDRSDSSSSNSCNIDIF